ncbi:MAG: beta-lactamase family protein [Acidobacteriota bacterium]|nr:MAG: beta-lactamase family protein [Acidobacteriota bacterium]
MRSRNTQIAPRRIVPLLIAVLLFVCPSVYGQSLSQQIDSYVSSRVKGQEFSGIVLVALDGKVVVQNAYGMADHEYSVPNTPQTKFRIGSVTKPLTAIAVAKLQEMGKLDFEDSICKFISDCPAEWQLVRIRHLLTHTSGIPDLFGAMDAVPVEKTSDEIDRIVKSLKNRQLQGQPGEEYKYSNFGYCLLGYVIEKASGKLYTPFLTENILGPVGMSGTLYDDPRPIINERAQGYVRKDGQVYNDKLTDPAGYSAGGLLSTAGDLFLLDRALFSGKLLSKKSLDRMFTAYKNEYGFGWKVTSRGGKRLYNHTGATHGFSAHIARYPDDDVLIVILSNIETENASETASWIAEIVFDPERKSGAEPGR